MTKYVENMINNFLVKLGKKDAAKTPAGDNLFNLGIGAKLDTKRSEIYVQESRIQIKRGTGKS
jgi:hypothetical protein